MNVYELFRAGYISTRVYNALAIGIMREKYRYKLMNADDYWVITCTIDELFEYYSEQELLTFRRIGPKAIEELNIARGRIPEPKVDGNETHKNGPMTPTEFAVEMRKICTDPSRDPEEAHRDMDILMCKVLRKLGYGTGVNVFIGTPRWYA